jgi:hypothetical protein
MGMSKGVKERYHNDPEYRAQEQEKHNRYCRERYKKPEIQEKAIKYSRLYRIKNGCDPEKMHGLFKTRAWQSWHGMIQRVFNPNNGAHERYKNLAVDPRWMKFINFYEDMGECPEGLTIDRKNNSAGYSKDNCRWATYAEQARNRSSCVLNEEMVKVIRLKGEQGISGASIARDLGVHPDRVCSVLAGRTWKGVAENV